MKSETIEYSSGAAKLKGHFVYDETKSGPRPAVLVAHAWRGQDDFARKKAGLLAELGYVGFAADLYGNGKSVETDGEAAALMVPLFIDRKTLRSRIVAAYQTLAKDARVDKTKIGAIGFCFGGLTVLELLRSGVDLQGVVSFHGLLGDSLEDTKAKLEAPAAKLHGSLLLLHGYKDPLMSQEDITNIQKEFSEAKIDWQMHIYGSASHAFTNPHANEPETGLMYHPQTERRALQSMQNFFSEIFE